MKSPRLVALSALALTSIASQPHADVAQTPVSPERPWEVIADNGDMVLPDLYYSEKSENEQVMPMTVHGRLQINHLIYPTIGNPKLYLKDSPSDSLLVVLRLEPKYLNEFSAQHGSANIRGRNLNLLTLSPSQAGDGISFYLIPRALRTDDASTDLAAKATSIRGTKGIIPLTPNLLGIQPHYPKMPSLFLKRETVRAYFDKAMKSVPEGLYDIRMEVVSGGKLQTYDSTYNGVQVFDRGPQTADDFRVLNFSDAQVNTGWMFQKFATPHLRELVQYLTTTNEPQVTTAKYITFNGDLHDGGSVLQRYPRGVGHEYQAEAETIFDQLKKLKKPIFLTCGNHDGYVSMGHVPNAIDGVTRNEKVRNAEDKLALDLDESKFGAALKKIDPSAKVDDPRGLDPIDVVVQEVIDNHESTWPNLTLDAFEQYLSDTQGNQGGYHNDIFQGRHTRTVGDDFGTWREVDGERNMVFYDGQYQWRKTYGPLYYDYSFGPNRFISLNSFELRQHWRTGWGMYTVNYGGGMSTVQMDWLKRELQRFAGSDVTLFAHHDPRGGHNGKDYPYYFSYVDYGAQVTTSGDATDALRPNYFTYDKIKLGHALAHYEQDPTLLREWKDDKETAFMNFLFKKAKDKYGDNGGMMYSFMNFAMGDTLEASLCKGQAPADNDTAELGCMHDGLQEWMTRDPDFDHGWYSGYELINLITTNTNVRTMVLGHTHFNSIDEFQSGDALVPNQVTLSSDTLALQKLENSGPMRSKAIKQSTVDAAKADVSYKFERILQGQGRELVIIRVTTAADLTSQYVGTDSKDKMYGFQVLTFSPSPDFATGLTADKLNRLDFYRNKADGKADYVRVTGLDIKRNQEWRAANGNGQEQDLVDHNPLHYTFHLGKKPTADCRGPDQVLDDAWSQKASTSGCIDPKDAQTTTSGSDK